MADSNKTVSSVEDFRSRVETIITLSDYDSDGNKYELNVRVKKMSMTALVSGGVIPNTLMQKAISLKDPNRNKKKPVEQTYSSEMIEESLTAMKSIAKAILLEPTYDELEGYLTDSHLAQLVAYVSGGVKSLEGFRNEQESARRNISGSEVSTKAE